MSVKQILHSNPVVPVVVINDVDKALPLADALLAGGINTIEVTLRTPEAAPAMALIARARPDMVVGAGTVLDKATAQIACDSGARFVVSPGVTAPVIAACAEHNLPLLPGAQTVSEIMNLRDQGFRHLKFFPASAVGGVRFLSALQTVIPDMSFCPTGGITAETAKDWLALSNVISVGGSWLCSPRAIAAGDFAAITRAAQQTRQWRRSS